MSFDDETSHSMITRTIQKKKKKKKKNLRDNCEYFCSKCWINFLKLNLNFLYLIDLIPGVLEYGTFSK